MTQEGRADEHEDLSVSSVHPPDPELQRALSNGSNGEAAAEPSAQSASPEPVEPGESVESPASTERAETATTTAETEASTACSSPPACVEPAETATTAETEASTEAAETATTAETEASAARESSFVGDAPAEAAPPRGPGVASARVNEAAASLPHLNGGHTAPLSKAVERPPAEAGYAVSLPTFEGPLDLLLQLCQKHELDILDIPIGFVTEKYLEYLSLMQFMNLDIAAEYLVMAATLAHIKSKMLLPAPPPGQEDDTLAEEEEDPREALIRRLLEYQKYKQAAADLSARGITGRDVFPRGIAMEEVEQSGLPPLAEVPLFSLLEAFQAVLSRAKVKLTHDIVTDRISITDRIHELVGLLRDRKRLEFTDLFSTATTRFDLVITFLALLEMTRLRMTRLFQTDPLSPIYVEVPEGAIGSPDDESIQTS